MILKRYNNVKWYPNDTRVAFAIRGGLIELCLTFIERFGVLESFDKKKDNGISSLFFSIKMILANIYWIRLHKKTAKAIRSKRHMIEKELARLERNAKITNDINCKKVLGMTRNILDINGCYCCRCNKALNRTEVKLCNSCNIVAYCSRACQKKDWHKRHKLACCKTYTIEKVGQFQGRVMPRIVPAKLKEMEINANMIQLKLFLDHSETILSQVKELDIPLYDCVVRFDLTSCPLEVTTDNYIDHDDPELKKSFEDSRSKENIACIFIAYMYDGSLVDGKIPTLNMQRLFPHEWLSEEGA